MNRSVVVPIFDQSDSKSGIGMFVHPSKAILELQQRLIQQFDCFELQPEHLLHVTLMAVVSGNIELTRRQEIFAHDLQEIIDQFCQLEFTSLPTEIIFDSLKVTDRGVILLASNQDIIPEIRNQIKTAVNIPKEANKPPPIVHTTIARFTREVNIEPIKQQFDTNDIRITVQLDQPRLFTHFGRKDQQMYA